LPRALVERAIASPWPAEFETERLDGRRITLEVTLSRLDSPGHALAILRDATERKCSEEARVRFLSVLSHELRTPISTVLGFGSLVVDGLAGPLSDQQRHYLQRLLIAADDLHSLVNDLLDLGQLHAGRFVMHRQAFALSVAVSEVIEGLMPQAEAKRLTIRNEVPPDLMAIPADGKRIAQVLRNLLGNAIKYSPDAGHIRVRGACEEGALLCEIEDTGPGIPAESHARLFEPFVRLGDPEIPGTGLGLNIAKALVEAHEGTIGVRRRSGPGAIFWFTLPIAPLDALTCPSLPAPRTGHHAAEAPKKDDRPPPERGLSEGIQ
jgi:signal transduction histidine kinase